jgi:hypothetical protein
VKAWTRKKFKGCNALKKKINPTRVPIDLGHRRRLNDARWKQAWKGAEVPEE